MTTNRVPADFRALKRQAFAEAWCESVRNPGLVSDPHSFLISGQAMNGRVAPRAYPEPLSPKLQRDVFVYNPPGNVELHIKWGSRVFGKAIQDADGALTCAIDTSPYVLKNAQHLNPWVYELTNLFPDHIRWEAYGEDFTEMFMYAESVLRAQYQSAAGYMSYALTGARDLRFFSRPKEFGVGQTAYCPIDWTMEQHDWACYRLQGQLTNYLSERLPTSVMRACLPTVEVYATDKPKHPELPARFSDNALDLAFGHTIKRVNEFAPGEQRFSFSSFEHAIAEQEAKVREAVNGSLDKANHELALLRTAEAIMRHDPAMPETLADFDVLANRVRSAAPSTRLNRYLRFAENSGMFPALMRRDTAERLAGVTHPEFTFAFDEFTVKRSAGAANKTKLQQRAPSRPDTKQRPLISPATTSEFLGSVPVL